MIDVVMPQMGESLTEGTVVKWLKSPGDAVRRDEPLFEISTDKVDTEVPSPADGALAEVLVPVGEVVAVGTPVARLSTSGSEAAAPAPGSALEERTKPPAATSDAGGGGHFKSSHAPQLVSFRSAPAPQRPARPAPSAGAAAGARSWSPAVLEAARQGGVPLATLTGLAGSGRGGRVTKRDVERFLAEGGDAPVTGTAPVPAAGAALDPPAEYVYRPGPDDRVVPMSRVRQRIAQHMSWSVRISPHATAFAECDMSRAAALIADEGEAFRARVGASLTYTALVARAAVTALRDFPTLNASVVGEALALKPRVNLGVAVALPESDELIVPVVHAADELSLEGLARAIGDAARRARAGRLTPQDVQGGSFTLTNPGVFGGVTGTPILNQPQVAILGLGAITKRPVVIDDAIAIRPVMTASLTFDHRAADGMVAFRYLERLRQLCEELPDRFAG